MIDAPDPLPRSVNPSISVADAFTFGAVKPLKADASRHVGQRPAKSAPGEIRLFITPGSATNLHLPTGHSDVGVLNSMGDDGALPRRSGTAMKRRREVAERGDPASLPHLQQLPRTCLFNVLSIRLEDRRRPEQRSRLARLILQETALRQLITHL